MVELGGWLFYALGFITVLHDCLIRDMFFFFFLMPGDRQSHGSEFVTGFRYA